MPRIWGRPAGFFRLFGWSGELRAAPTWSLGTLVKFYTCFRKPVFYEYLFDLVSMVSLQYDAFVL